MSENKAKVLPVLVRKIGKDLKRQNGDGIIDAIVLIEARSDRDLTTAPAVIRTPGMDGTFSLRNQACHLHKRIHP